MYCISGFTFVYSKADKWNEEQEEDIKFELIRIKDEIK